MTTTTRCQHITCRVREDRQDLQCTRLAGHDGNHLHTIALGWCNGRYSNLPMQSAEGRKGGHTNPVAA